MEATVEQAAPDPIGEWLHDEEDQRAGWFGTEGLPWRPTTRADLEWLVGRILACDEEVARIQSQAAKLARRQQDTKERLLALFGADMERIARAELARENEGKKRPRASLDLLTGTCKWNRRGGGLSITDPAATVAWIEAQFTETTAPGVASALQCHAAETGPDALTLRDAVHAANLQAEVMLLKTPLVAHLKETGELPPGCEVTPVEEVFAVAGARKGGEA